MTTGIYKITCISTGKYYIGSSWNCEKRFSEHKCRLNSNTHPNKIIQNSWNKYGHTKFNFEIVHVCEKIKLLEIEQNYIDILCPAFNISKLSSSSLGTKRTPEQKLTLKLSAQKRCKSKEYINKLRNAMKKRWANNKEKMMLARKGKKHSEETKEKLRLSSKTNFENNLGNIKTIFAESNNNRYFTQEHKKKISDKAIERYSNNESLKAKLSEHFASLWKDEEIREKMMSGRKGRKHSDETKQILREKAFVRSQDKEYIKKISDGVKRSKKRLTPLAKTVFKTK